MKTVTVTCTSEMVQIFIEKIYKYSGTYMSLFYAVYVRKMGSLVEKEASIMYRTIFLLH